MDALVPQSDRGGPAQPLLLASGLRKHFPVAGGLLGRATRVVRAVDDLSLSVAKGETLGVVGESGCGKSTVARLLMRLIKPDRGTMVLDGDPVDEPHGITVNELRRQVQMVFQDSYASLNPRLTIVETLAFAPKAHALPAVDAAAGSPLPPYTQALLWARRSTAPRTRPKEAPIKGDPPNPIDPPSGCRSRTRCPFAEAVCARAEPLLADSGAQSVACHMRVRGSGHTRAP